MMLDTDYQPVRWIPYSSLNERKGHLRARISINPADNIRYLLVGGASSSTEDSLARIYSPTSSNLLNFAGLVTARELEAEFLFMPSGEIRVQVIQPKHRKVRIDPMDTVNASSNNVN
ncbi:MAG: hypothetical protein HKN70_08425 [Gammaproteobacteria bacterium]|nr:hypothetical protein [Gammaproteobacteria bacterium]